MSISIEKDNISSALELLRSRLGDEEQRVRDEAVNAMQAGEYDTASSVIDFGKRLLTFREEVDALAEKWQELEEFRDVATPQIQQTSRARIFLRNEDDVSPRRSFSTIQRFPQNTTTYCIHILEVLVAKGGSALNQDIQIAVNKTIKMLYPKFKQARAMLAQNGWTNGHSTIHSLEISEAGRSWLASRDVVEDAVTPPAEVIIEADFTYAENQDPSISEDYDDLQI